MVYAKGVRQGDDSSPATLHWSIRMMNTNSNASAVKRNWHTPIHIKV